MRRENLFVHALPNRVLFGASLLALSCSLLLLNGSRVDAVEPDQQSNVIEKSPGPETPDADALVNEALYGEIYGDESKRTRLLNQAIEINSDHALARWHLGFVKVRKNWMSTDEIIEKNLANRTLQKYNDLKSELPTTVQQHLSAANWCRSKKMSLQERAHLEAIILLEPHHAVARRRLGHQRVNRSWLTPEQVRAENAKFKTDQDNLLKWRGKLMEIGRLLHHKNDVISKRAELKLKSISDTTAILPMETILSGSDQQTSLLVVETISRMTDQEAADSLARHAVFSPWDEVRQAAAVKLRNYDSITYAPMMLAELATPITGVRWVVDGANNRLYYRQMLISEKQTSTQTAISDIEYRRVSAGASQRTARERALANMRREANEDDLAIRMQNMQTQDLNERIIAAMTIATKQDLGEDPRDWWQWWDDKNDVVVEQKQQEISTETRSVEIVDQIEGISGECLVAGTQILTGCGLKAVEEISIGDTVLSRNPATGELALKPVVRKTIRRAGKLVSFTAGEQQVTCSQGHPFWVSGTGWVMARNLQIGMSLHTSNGVASIEAIADGGTEETYNMIVADFHTYFVGKELLFSHDVTMREPVDVVVPGLQQ